MRNVRLALPIRPDSRRPHDTIGTAVLDHIVTAAVRLKGNFAADAFHQPKRFSPLAFHVVISCESSAQIMEFFLIPTVVLGCAPERLAWEPAAAGLACPQ